MARRWYESKANPRDIGIREKYGMLEALCWCQKSIVLVFPQTLRHGRTGSCGLPGCDKA